MKAIWTSCLALLLTTLVACGGSSSSPIAPPPPNNAGYSNASLSGSYVFSLHGIGPSGEAFAAVGVFTADGNGNITSGQQDVNDSVYGLQQQAAISSGTYSVGTDGRGQATLNFAGGNSAALSFVLVSASKARIIELSNAELSSGLFEQQVPAALSALTGPTYVLRMDGSSSNGAVISRVGLLTATGTGPSASVVLDENYNGTFTPTIAGSNVNFSFSGTSGRGVLQFVTAQGGANPNAPGTVIDLVFYVVNSTRVEFLSVNTSEQLSGYADAQSGAFTTASVSSPYVYSISGYSATGFINETGSFTLNSGAVSTGLEDFIDTGTYSASVPFTGTYAADSINNGHFTGSFSASGRTVNFALWFSSPQNAVLMAYNSTSSLLESGLVAVQPAVPTTSTVSGNYALHLGGLTNNAGLALFDGQLLADGQGTFTGLEDFNQGGSVATGVSAVGNYSVASGRGTGTIGGIPVVLYPASSSTTYIMSTDGSRMLTGSLEAQH